MKKNIYKNTYAKFNNLSFFLLIAYAIYCYMDIPNLSMVGFIIDLLIKIGLLIGWIVCTSKANKQFYDLVDKIGKIERSIGRAEHA